MFSIRGPNPEKIAIGFPLEMNQWRMVLIRNGIVPIQLKVLIFYRTCEAVILAFLDPTCERGWVFAGMQVTKLSTYLVYHMISISEF